MSTINVGDYVTWTDMPGIAFYVKATETAPDTDTEWSGIENETGNLVIVMVGDDREWSADPSDLTSLDEDAYCHECGQIGCSHDGRDRSLSEEQTYTDLFDAAPAAQTAADATGVAHHVRKERATGLLVVQPSEPVDGRRFLTVWGPAEPTSSSSSAAPLLGRKQTKRHG